MVARMKGAYAIVVSHAGATNTKGSRWRVAMAGLVTRFYDATMHTKEEAVQKSLAPVALADGHRAELPNGDTVFTFPKT